MPWVTIDCQYLFPQFAASFLRVVNGRAIFIENNTVHAVPRLMKELRSHQVSPENVDFLIVTHAHLDHAGGTSLLADLCPRATVLAHPKAARTLINPERIIESAKKVYGEKKFLELYGEIKPVPEERVRLISDGEAISWQDTPLKFFFTAGHASHHFCVLDEKEKAIFTGDSFGLCYPALKGTKDFHFPSTSPIDFDFEEAIRSVDKIVASGAETAFLTHFGPVGHLKRRGEELKRHLAFHQGLIDRAILENISSSVLQGFMVGILTQYVEAELKGSGINSTEEVRDLLRGDLELNAAGLAYCVRKKREAKSK